MLCYLENSLRKLLTSEISSLVIGEHIFFDPPDDTFDPSLPAVNLFLYDMRENLGLRNTDWQIERSNGIATRQPPPMRVIFLMSIFCWVKSCSCYALPDPACCGVAV